jgi:uncharacterized protein (DUF1778 family)
MALSHRKNNRFDLRATASQKATIEQAAMLRQTSATSFIMDAAYEAAQRLVHDRYHPVLNSKQWKVFCAALDAPPKINRKLRALMSKHAPWQ